MLTADRRTRTLLLAVEAVGSDVDVLPSLVTTAGSVVTIFGSVVRIDASGVTVVANVGTSSRTSLPPSW